MIDEGGYSVSAVFDVREHLEDEEIRHVKKVLGAAAMTYVAAAATSIAQLLRLILIARDRD